MHAMVTGGAGFIGSHLSRKLISLNWDVTICDNLSSGKKENIPNGVNFIYADLTDETSVNLFPNQKIDVVFHLASHVGQELSFERPVHDLKTNSNSTMILLDWCLKKKIKQFIFASTMNIYGTPEEEIVDENSKTSPPSPYSVGKLASEFLCKIYSDFGIKTSCLRLFNVYGPGQDFSNLKQGMVSIFMSYFLKNETLIVKGSKNRFRDFIYVDDVVNAFIMSINQKDNFNIYNVSTGVKTYVWELIESISKAFGFNKKEYPIKFLKGTIKDQFGIYGNSSKLEKELKWKPKIDIEKGIYMMAEHAKKNKS